MSAASGMGDGNRFDTGGGLSPNRPRSTTPTSVNTSVSGRFLIAADAAPMIGGPVVGPMPALPVSLGESLREGAGGAEAFDATPSLLQAELAFRIMNVVIAGLAMLLLAPVYMLVALAVRLTSPGPVFYTQTRIGLDRRAYKAIALDERRLDDLGGQPFTIIKFRSMRVDAEVAGQAVWATKHDSRVTPIGTFLRKTRLDEIPQLMNVLRGDMNIVGPRPERPSIVVRLRQEIPEYPLRHRVKPGITGWAQINHSYDASIDDVRRKVAFDLEYIGQRSVWVDLKIMAMTIPVMVFRRGAH